MIRLTAALRRIRAKSPDAAVRPHYKRASTATAITVVSILALSGCVTQETIERDRKIESIKADARARLERERQQAIVSASIAHDAACIERAKQDPGWQAWYREERTQQYECELCSMPRGIERDQALASAARDYHLHVLTCRPECQPSTAETAPASRESPVSEE